MRLSFMPALALAAIGLLSRPARAEWNQDHLDKLARELAEKIGMPIDKATPAIDRLRLKISDEGLLQRVNGVIAYQMGEGGLILKVKKGKGAVHFRKGSDVNIELKSLSVGANVGGSSEWGVGVILDLTGGEPAFGGKYKGSVKGATAGDASVSVTDLRRSDTSDPTAAHRVILVGSATGLSANAGESSLTITVLR